MVSALPAYKTLKDKLDLVVQSENVGLTGDAQKDFAFFTADYLQNRIGELGARTNSEVAALYDTLAAELKAIKTKAEVKEAIAAVDALISALPSTITEADAAAVEAAWKAAKALEDVHPTAAPKKANELKNALAQLAAVEGKAVNKAIFDFDKIAKPSKDEVKALLEKVQAYTDKFETGAIFEGITPTRLSKDAAAIKAELNRFRDAELADVEKAINAIPLNVTLADKATVEAARKAYDAFVEEWNSYADNYDAVSKVTNRKELFLAEAAIEALEREAKITATESLKLSVSTKLYKKSNKIRVNWKVKDGDASYIDGYQVYKSTKAQKNYKYMGKTKKSYMDNKKGLKKGTRYFYKVRAYVEIDGQKYYSDWSNKGNRIYK